MTSAADRHQGATPVLQLQIDRLTLAAGVDPESASFVQLLEAVIDSLTRLRKNGPDSPPEHGAVVSPAIRFMIQNLHRKFVMPELAAAVGVSPRTLSLSFSRELSTSPRRYLHELRLDRIREELLTSLRPPRVGDVAVKYGLTHLGRFAADYRTRFGERPSHTRARALAAATAAAAPDNRPALQATPEAAGDHAPENFSGPPRR